MLFLFYFHQTSINIFLLTRKSNSTNRTIKRPLQTVILYRLVPQNRESVARDRHARLLPRQQGGDRDAEPGELSAHRRQSAQLATVPPLRHGDESVEPAELSPAEHLAQSVHHQQSPGQLLRGQRAGRLPAQPGDDAAGLE